MKTTAHDAPKAAARTASARSNNAEVESRDASVVRTANDLAPYLQQIENVLVAQLDLTTGGLAEPARSRVNELLEKVREWRTRLPSV